MHSRIDISLCPISESYNVKVSIGRRIYCAQVSVVLCRPFFLPCLLAALVSAVALVSNAFMLKETLPRIVQARAARHAQTQKDETAPLLAAENGQSGSDIGGKPSPLPALEVIADSDAPCVCPVVLLCSLTRRVSAATRIVPSVRAHYRHEALPCCTGRSQMQV